MWRDFLLFIVRIWMHFCLYHAVSEFLFKVELFALDIPIHDFSLDITISAAFLFISSKCTRHDIIHVPRVQILVFEDLLPGVCVALSKTII